MAARILAFLAAVAMVVGAVVVRDRLDQDTERRTTSLRLVCATELAAVCEALADEPGTKVITTIEPAAETAGRLTALAPGRAPDLDGWLVPGPWPAMVAEARKGKELGPLLSTGPVLARSPVVLAVWPERATVLSTRCPPGGPGWKCLGEVAGRSWQELPEGQPTWGPVKPGLPPPSTAVGLAVIGAATVAYFGGRVDLSSTDLEDGGYRDWLTRLQRSIPPIPGSQMENMVLRGRSAFDAVGTIEAEAGPLLARARRDKPTLLYPSPVTTADVVLGTAGGRAAALLTELVSGPEGRRVLASSGWRVAGETRARGVPTTPALPDVSGLPSPGLLVALRQRVAASR